MTAASSAADGETVVLIGPVSAGKSTVAPLLAARLGRPHAPMDDLRWGYYAEIGFSREEEAAAMRRGGFAEMARYWKPFEAYAAGRIVADRRGSVIDFGAGHSVYDDPALLERVRRALEPVRHVVLLLPAPDPDRSVALLRARGWDGVTDGFDWHDYMVRHPANPLLAKQIVFTEGRTPEETCADIARLMAPASPDTPGLP